MEQEYKEGIKLQGVKLNENEEEKFMKVYKKAIYCELHAKELLTEQQLNQLLNKLY